MSEVSESKQDKEDQQSRVCHVDLSKSLNYQKRQIVVPDNITEQQKTFVWMVQDRWLNTSNDVASAFIHPSRSSEA